MPNKGVSEHDWLRGFEVLYGEWYLPEDVHLHSNYPNPEVILLKKEAWENLSMEAKEMIDYILNSPAEIVDLLKTPKRKLLTKRSIRRYFRRYWSSKFITDITIKEITRWVNQL